MLSNIKIATKIYFFIAIIICLITLQGAVSFSQMKKIGIELVGIAQENIPITNSFTGITINQLEQAILFQRGLGAALKFQFKKVTNKSIIKFLDAFKILSSKNEKLILDVEELVEEAILFTHTEKAKKEFKSLLDILKMIEHEHKIYDKEVITVLSNSSTMDIESLLKKEKLISSITDKIDQKLIEALLHVQQFTLESAIQAKHDEIIGQKMILIISIVTCLFAGILGFFISRAITFPVNSMRDSLQILASKEADLNTRLPLTKDETGEAAIAFNLFINKLQEMVVHISNTTVNLDNDSNKSIIMMENALLDIEEQQQQTFSVASSVSQMTDSIREVSNSTFTVEELGKKLENEINISLNSAKESQKVIEKLGSNVDLVSNGIELLAQESNRIEEVLNGIKGIAEQTNLLALNAAIEAARAGESGRGFAVVADEVRTLAQRTQSSTQDIQNLLETLQHEVTNSVNSMEQGKIYAVTCMEKSLFTTESLNIAMEAINQVSALNKQISSESKEQTKVASTINEDLQGIRTSSINTTQKTVEAAEKTKTVSENLRDLKKYVQQLKT